MKRSLGWAGLVVAVCVLLAACAAAPAMKEAALTEASPPSGEPGAAAAGKSAEKDEAGAAVADSAKLAAPAGVAAASMAEAPAAAPSAAAQPVTRYLSADDSNSAASPVIARRLIEAGRYVQPSVVRTYEFLNYHSFSYAPPASAPIVIYAQMRPSTKPGAEPGELNLQVAVRSADRRLAELPPLALTILLDSSGSMIGAPMELAKAAVRGLAGRLRPGDRLSLVVCNRKAEVLLQGHTVGPNPAAEAAEVASILSRVRADDITDLNQGIAAAYQTALKGYDYRYLSRVVVISDGGANAGELALQTIAKHAEDSDRQGIYLAGIGVGEGFNDQLMDGFTDKGRGAYLFLDGEAELGRLLEERAFVAAFDVAVKNVRLKMVMPPGWRMVEFHGEQVSARAADVVPQYLSANDQMIYHLSVAPGGPLAQARDQVFEFEAEYTPVGGKPARPALRTSVAEMLTGDAQIVKGDAVVAFAEMLKEIDWPLEENRTANLAALDEAAAEVRAAAGGLGDPELKGILALLERYRRTLDSGEEFPGSRDRDSEEPADALGLAPAQVLGVTVSGPKPGEAVGTLSRLGSSAALVPLEGYRFLALSSGPVGNPSPAGGGELAGRTFPDPLPEFMGARPAQASRQRVHDLHQVRLQLRAPANARSFSFDFNFFSAEYPEYVNQSFNDTFYAIIEAASTNQGRPTNICFDANNASIEVDNNYFQNPFHPIPNTGTGFDAHGSTGWLRTSWPIRGGEKFFLTFSIHDEGDGIYDSLALLDNFQWHEHEAVGTTDPLN